MSFSLLLRELDDCGSVDGAIRCFGILRENLELRKKHADKELKYSEEDLLDDASIITTKFVRVLERIKDKGQGRAVDST